MPNEPAEDRSVRGNTIRPAKVEPKQPIEDKYLAPADLSLKRAKKTVTLNANSSSLEILPDTERLFSVAVVPDENGTTVGEGDNENTDIEYHVEKSLDAVNVDIANTDGVSHTVVIRWLYVESA